MKNAEELLSEKIEIGGSNLFLVCDDLKEYILRGLLVESPIDCSLDDILTLRDIETRPRLF